MSLRDLVASSLGASKAFNWTWFIELCVCGILVLFFCFYFNRLFATIVSYFIRLYTWRTLRVWIDVQAIQVSLLGGRIFFKGVRYHGENETILVHSGHITFRFWLRAVKQVDLARVEDEEEQGEEEDVKDPKVNHDKRHSSSESTESNNQDAELGSLKKADTSKARVAIFVSGVEWFIYNRSPLYDAIVRDGNKATGLNDHVNAANPKLRPPNGRQSEEKSNVRRRQVRRDSPPANLGNSMIPETEPSQQSAHTSIRSQGGLSDHDGETKRDYVGVSLVHKLLVRLLPVYVECSRAAVSMGNETTRALLVTTIQKAKGHIDASSCGPLDIFRQIFDFHVQHPIIRMKPNPDYQKPQLTFAERLLRGDGQKSRKTAGWKVHLDFRKHRNYAVQNLKAMIPWWHTSMESLDRGHPGSNDHNDNLPNAGEPDDHEWHGLDRYMDQNQVDEHQPWIDIEYARFSTLVDCPAIHLVFYWDVPGRILTEHSTRMGADDDTDINGSKPPAYGLDLTVIGGDINYGPWADRLRAEIQAMFLPASYHSSTPAAELTHGEWRQSTTMMIRIDIEDDVTLRIPTRERSKDWRWRGRAAAVRDAAALRKQREKRSFRFRRGSKNIIGPEVRPFGWIAVCVARNSSVRYTMDMVAGPSGYRNKLDLDLRDTKATSSVNHALLWRCVAQKVKCDLSNPLQWNGLHKWQFDIRNESMELFLLRDHMFLLTDLISDFTAGLKSDYMTFIPFHYNIGLEFINLQLLLNANDFNIIDIPGDYDSNAFLVLGMDSLDGKVQIPMDHYAPPQSSVLFEAHGSRAYLDLKTPAWNTLHTFSKHEVMATLRELVMDGSYTYHAAQSPQLTDTLIMNILGRAPKFHLEGYLIRYFMNVQENYFGEHLHFRTLEEYLTTLNAGARPQTQHRPQRKIDNDLDVILSVEAEDTYAVMPTNLYERQESLRIDVMKVVADMRFTNYYMDLQVDSSPVAVSAEIADASRGSDYVETSQTQLHIDTVSVYGHRLFGAPPMEPTYVCNWDFDIGTVQGECSTKFVRILTAAIESFVFTLDDDENALSETSTVALNDVTFLKARTSGINVWITDTDAAYNAEIAAFDLAFNDWAGPRFSKEVTLKIPLIKVAAVDIHSAHRNGSSSMREADTFSCIQTSLELAILDRNPDFERTKSLQQRHIRFHDLQTHRAACLLRPVSHTDAASDNPEWSEAPPAMLTPLLPVPIFRIPARDAQQSTLSLRNSLQSTPPSYSSVSATQVNHRSKQVRRPDSSELKQATKSGVFPQLTDRRDRSRAEHRRSTVTMPQKDPCTRAITKKSFSSPWIPPYYALQGIEPDTNNLPEDTASSRLLFAPHNQDLSQMSAATGHDSKSGHTSIICSLPTGVRGFCRPQLFPHLANLISSLISRGPTNMLDSIQRSTVSQIKQHYLPRSARGQDACLDLPFVAIRLVNETDESGSAQSSIDKYEVTTTGMRLMLRRTPDASESTQSRTKDAILAQVSIEKITFDVQQFWPHGHSIAGLRASLAECSVWVSTHDKAQADAKTGAFEIATSSSDIDKLALLVQRSIKMGGDIATSMQKLDESVRCRHVIHYLTTAAGDIHDPAFLSRPSYVLRSAQNHVRMSDSWKIIAILRQRQIILRSLADLPDFEKHVDGKAGAALRADVVSSLSQYGSYDPETSYKFFLEAVFGQPTSVKPLSTKVDDIQTALFCEKISLLLDPGPLQSEIQLQNCDFGLIQKPSLFQHTATTGKIDHVRRSRKFINGWIASITVNLNWEILTLIEKVGLGLRELSSNSGKVVQHVKSMPVELPQEDEDLMIVFGTDEASLCMSTINLDLSLSATGLKSSTTFQNNAQQYFVSTVLTADTSQGDIQYGGTRLLSGRLMLPNIYFSHDKGPDLKIDTLRVAATCAKLRFAMHMDPVEVLEVLTAVMQNEVKAVRAVTILLQEQEPEHTTDAAAKSLVLPDLHVALLLDDYNLSFALFPTLSYAVSGQVARTSIVPYTDAEFAIHVDIKRNHHRLFKPFSATKESIPILEAPPVNIEVQVHLQSNMTKIRVHSAIERIGIEASAVQACLDALYKPENVDYIKAAQSASRDFQTSLRESSSYGQLKATQRRVQQPTSSVQYSGYVALAGLVVRCNAPAHRDQKYEARLKFELRGVTLHVQNINHARDALFRLPQFELKLPKILLALYRVSASENRNAGWFRMGLQVTGRSKLDDQGVESPTFEVLSDALCLDLFAGTPAVAVDTIAHIQERIKSFTQAPERPKIDHLRRFRSPRLKQPVAQHGQSVPEPAEKAEYGGDMSALLNASFRVEVNMIQVRWILDDRLPTSPGRQLENLVFSIRKIELYTQRETSARLSILDLQLQLVPQSHKDNALRTRTSALLPEIVFKATHVSTATDRRFAFQAAGKILDLRLAADGILALSAIHQSLADARTELRASHVTETDAADSPPLSTSNILGNKKLASLLVDAEFAGAILTVTPRPLTKQHDGFSRLVDARAQTPRGFARQAEEAVLRAPGVTLKIEYRDTQKDVPSLSTEMKVAASSNTLSPSVVPLILDIYSSIKESMGDNADSTPPSGVRVPTQNYLSGAANTDTDPTAVLGRLRLNAGLWVQRQEFSLTCQPIARVQATALFDDIFITANTNDASEGDEARFISIITKFNNLRASVQHVYSRESTASFQVESIVMSLMNSRHVSSKNGISAILTVSPMSTDINARQLQDFLLFREIWYPDEFRATSTPVASAPASTTNETQVYAMQKYQALTATAVLPWHAIISITELKVQVDFGQSLGKSSFTIAKLWASSKKNSDSEQNLCLGFARVGIDSVGRMSGFIEMQNLQARTSIRWPTQSISKTQAPLIQASVGFQHLRLKVAFDYQPFAVADVSTFDFLMYNVRSNQAHEKDRLVAILDGGKVQVFCISAAGGQALAIVQSFERLFQEKRDAYRESLREHNKRVSSDPLTPLSLNAQVDNSTETAKAILTAKINHLLHTDVVVTLRTVDIGAFPNTFFDTQILKIEAGDVQARFAVATIADRVRSGLSMSLGQVRVALSTAARANTKAMGEVEISEVIERATGSKGGTILQVPRLVASMQTWQQEKSNTIEYIFRSTFQGKVDVGWNYSRISFIRGMWETHCKALASRLGKPLPQAAVKIKAENADETGQEKITAVVNVPQSSKYTYVPLEPPIIDTPQLRDMGEATPPLEWIGLNRDKLPNVTHSIVIVSLLEVAREVEDAYTRILGTN